jgi:hypothetical protein
MSQAVVLDPKSHPERRTQCLACVAHHPHLELEMRALFHLSAGQDHGLLRRMARIQAMNIGQGRSESIIQSHGSVNCIKLKVPSAMGVQLSPILPSEHTDMGLADWGISQGSHPEAGGIEAPSVHIIIPESGFYHT